MPKFRVVYKNGFHKDFSASDATDARAKAKAEYRAWQAKHPGAYHEGSSAKAEAAGHQVAKVYNLDESERMGAAEHVHTDRRGVAYGRVKHKHNHGSTSHTHDSQKGTWTYSG